MKKQALRTLMVGSICWLMSPVIMAENIQLDYQYKGDTGVNLSAIAGGPLSFGTIADKRAEASGNEISVAGKRTYTITGTSPAELVKQAITEAFESSGATMADDSSLKLEGYLLDMRVQETADGLELLIRCELTLRNQSRSAWQSIVQSRTTINDNDIAQGIGQGLDRLIRSLFMDDYFLMELGIF